MKKNVLWIIFLLSVGFGSLEAQVLDAPGEQTKDGFYEKKHVGLKHPFPYPFVREADVVWENRVWREIKFEEKMNQFFYYPILPDQGQVNLMTAILDAAKEGRIKLYTDDMFEEERTWKEIEEANTVTVTLEIPDPDDEDQVKDTTFLQELRIDDIKAMRIKEIWFLDKARTVQDVRIIGFCAVIEQRDENELLKGVLPLFWVRYNDAEVRELLANTEAYNAKNERGKRSYDDVFVKRMFSSFILRESNNNNHHRTISEYAKGMDALAESERIKRTLEEIEDDMWEY